MTAQSGGGQPDNEGRSSTNSVLERPDVPASGARPAVRPLDQLFPLGPDSARAAAMQETWQAFGAERDGAVRAALLPERSPPEVAYAVGEIVHAFFRSRVLTLTSLELRRLVAELLEAYAPTPEKSAPAMPAPAPAAPVANSEPPEVVTVPAPAPAPTPAPTPAPAPARVEARADLGSTPRSVVSFASEPAATPWEGEERRQPEPSVPDSIFEPPPSQLVSLLGREDAAFDRLLTAVLDTARQLLGTLRDRAVTSAAILQAIERVAGDEGEPLSAETRQRLALFARTELAGLGLIDRLWADPTVHAIFVNGPGTVLVERNGQVEPSKESFRDEAHLVELLGHLMPRPATGVAQFNLRDGGTGTAVFPPAAPRGPVVTIRRAEPGAATFDRLIVADVLDRRMADLLRLAAHCRLNILVAGPPGSGKSALLAALVRDREQARVVTVARNRIFHRPAPSRVELVAVRGVTPLATLIGAGAGLQPDLLVVDSVELEDVPALVERLARSRGTVAAVEPESLAFGLAHSVDLVLRLGRGRDGQHRVTAMLDGKGNALFVHEKDGFRRRSTAPSFAATVGGLGLGGALASILR